MLRSDLWDYSDANIVEKVIINATGINATNKRNKKLSRIMLCLDHVYQKLTTHLQAMQKILILYNLLECSNNYSMTSGSLRNCYRDEVNDFAKKIAD